ncbi:MAG: PKD domain-containing protein, partial [Flavobacteriales bacterium]|nr:PKD domain-containing protein [Flavobacteriales bacterium]
VSLTINGTDNTTIADYIDIHANPQASFTVDDAEGCFPHCVNFSDLTVTGSGTIVEWSWDFGDGEVSDVANPSYCYDEIGNFTPVLSVEDEFGCFNAVSMPSLISIADQFPEAEITSSYQLNCLPPADFGFANTSTGETDLTYEWSFGDGETLSTNDESTVIHPFAQIGIYDVCLTAIDEIGCEDDSCITVEVFDIAQAQFDLSEDIICLGEAISFTDQTVPTPVAWSWDFDGDGVEDSNIQNPVYTYAGEGTFDPELTVTYTDECLDSEDQLYTVNVEPELVVDFIADTIASCQVPFDINFTNTTTGPGTITYAWTIDGAVASTATDFSNTFDTFGLFDIGLIASSS